MIDNLDDAIQHCLHRAEENRAQAENYARGEDYEQIKGQECEECAKDHDQLASWLTELAERREADRWIPVSERLPEYDGNYLVTFGNGFIDTAPYLTLTLGFGLFREVIDENNNCIGEDFDYWDVIAWKPLPKPYESEVTNER